MEYYDGMGSYGLGSGWRTGSVEQVGGAVDSNAKGDKKGRERG